MVPVDCRVEKIDRVGAGLIRNSVVHDRPPHADRTYIDVSAWGVAARGHEHDGSRARISDVLVTPLWGPVGKEATASRAHARVVGPSPRNPTRVCVLVLGGYLQPGPGR
jgi:hypothetical protein